MPDGGRLHIAARPVELASDATAFDVTPGRFAMIEVADNGSGMDAATLARVFEPFFTTKRFGLGSGLGLSMAYGFVKQSGGGIQIQSQPGQGTTVLMVLPLTTPEPDSDLPPERPGSPLAANWCCSSRMIPNVRRVVRQQLIDLGYPVIEAESGAQAIDMIEQIAGYRHRRQRHHHARWHQWPTTGRNGRRPTTRRCAIVLMSGYTDETDRDGASDLPVLAKPFSPAGSGAGPAAHKPGDVMKDAESPKLIVIVEDDPDVARIIEQVLERLSLSAPSGAAAPAICCADCGPCDPTCASSTSACPTWTASKSCSGCAPSRLAASSS